MNFIKLILIALGLILFGMLAFGVVGLIFNVLWYVLWIAVIALIGFVGYKMLKKDSDTARLEDKTPISIAGMENANRAFEDFRRKHLTK